MCLLDKIEKSSCCDYRNSCICIYLHNHVKGPNIQAHKMKFRKNTGVYMIVVKVDFGSIQELSRCLKL